MAEKKKSPSTARPRTITPAPAASSGVAAPVVSHAVASPAVTPPAVAPPVAPAVVAPVAPAVVAPAAALVTLAGLEVDERPMIHMPAPPATVPHDAIARRAQEIHNTRGGTAFDNWIEAERELGAR
ncbi:MAG: hypothetical protein V4850_12850 [Myxococcota bacterium]